MKVTKRQFILGVGATLAQPALVHAQAGEDIRIGATVPLSGPAAAYGAAGLAMDAYFSMINEQGGINGRKIKLLLADDGFTPNRTLEQTRRLVEGEKVLFMLGQVGTSTSLAARQYLNDAKVPQLFVSSGAPTWLDDIQKYPWSLSVQPTYVAEGRRVAEHILATRPNAKVGALYLNDDAGKGFVRGVREVLAQRPGMLVKEQTTENSEPTVDSQVIALQASGADTMVCFAIPRSTSQAIRRASEMQWSPQIYLSTVGTSIQQALVPAGLERSKGVIAAAYMKDPTDSEWANDAAVQAVVANIKKYQPKASLDASMSVGTTCAHLATQVLRQCGRELTRDNVLAQTMALDLAPAMLVPGLRVKTSPNQRAVVSSVRLQQFDGTNWKLMKA